MISAWTKHLKTDQEKERFKNSVLGSRVVLDRLQSLMDEEKADLENLENNPKLYDLPNWDYRQAHSNGFRAALKMVSKLINLDQQEKKWIY